MERYFRIDVNCPFYYEDRIDRQCSIDICKLNNKTITDCTECEYASDRFRERIMENSTTVIFMREQLNALFNDSDDISGCFIEMKLDDEGITGRASCSNCHKSVGQADSYCRHCGSKFIGRRYL